MFSMCALRAAMLPARTRSAPLNARSPARRSEHAGRDASMSGSLTASGSSSRSDLVSSPHVAVDSASFRREIEQRITNRALCARHNSWIPPRNCCRPKTGPAMELVESLGRSQPLRNPPRHRRHILPQPPRLDAPRPRLAPWRREHRLLPRELRRRHGDLRRPSRPWTRDTSRVAGVGTSAQCCDLCPNRNAEMWRIPRHLLVRRAWVIHSPHLPPPRRPELRCPPPVRMPRS